MFFNAQSSAILLGIRNIKIIYTAAVIKSIEARKGKTKFLLSKKIENLSHHTFHSQVSFIINMLYCAFLFCILSTIWSFKIRPPVSRSFSNFNLAMSSRYDGMSRAELQGLAKANGIKANIASLEIVKQLETLENRDVVAVSGASSKSTLSPLESVEIKREIVKKPKLLKLASPEKLAVVNKKPSLTKVKESTEQELEWQRKRLEIAQEKDSNPAKSLWITDKYQPSEIEAKWKSVASPLLTVGSKGVSETHVHSLEDLLKAHQHIRVKFASDKLNVQEMAESFVTRSAVLAEHAELLVIKKKEFMIGRTPSSKHWPKLSTMLQAKSGKNKQSVCHGCGEIGHHRIECPNKARPDFRPIGVHPNAERVMTAQGIDPAKKLVAKKNKGRPYYNE